MSEPRACRVIPFTDPYFMDHLLGAQKHKLNYE